MMRVEQQKQFTLEFLKAYHPANELERAHVQEVMAFIQSQDNPFYPQLPAGHITVSSILMDQKQQNILFHYHQKLDRWLQFGGHVEPDQDFNTLQAAIRELMEETGLSVTAFSVFGEGEPIDVDVHLIPARADFPAHPHHDLRYLFKMILPAKFDEKSFRWIPIEELLAWEDASIQRFAQKVFELTQPK
jgi:8-oxo-dGTP pyrophosphatase MutT (NUDIX family)